MESYSDKRARRFGFDEGDKRQVYAVGFGGLRHFTVTGAVGDQPSAIERNPLSGVFSGVVGKPLHCTLQIRPRDWGDKFDRRFAASAGLCAIASEHEHTQPRLFAGRQRGNLLKN